VAFLIVAICVIAFLGLYGRERKEAEELKLKVMYSSQNEVFHFSNSKSLEIYRGSEELDLNEVAIDLYAYNCDQSDYNLTIPEIVEYFSSEYADDGTLRIYSRPEAISKYISWYNHGGDDKAYSYRSKLVLYLSKNGYNNLYYDLDVSELQDILPKVE